MFINSCNYGCALDGTVARQGNSSVHGAIGGILNISISNDDEIYDSGSEPVNDLSCDIKTIPTLTFMHTDNISCNHGCALDGAVTRQGDESVHGAIEGVLNFSISNDDETYDFGSEPVNDLSYDIKTIPTPTFMHIDNTSCNQGCGLDRAVTRQGDGSVHGGVDDVLNLSIYSGNETYGPGSEPINDLSCDTRIISTPKVMHIGNFSQSIPCSREALYDIYPSLPRIPQVVFNS